MGRIERGTAQRAVIVPRVEAGRRTTRERRPHLQEMIP
jgi:hypothetical protein